MSEAPESPSIDFETAVQTVMKELGWSRAKAEEELLLAMETGELDYETIVGALQ